MREALFLIYAGAMIVAASAVNRVRPLQVAVQHGVTPALIGYIYLSIILLGGFVGFLVPQWIAEFMPSANGASPPYRSTDVGVLGRLVQLVGVVCGAWIALRGLWLWTVLGLVGLAVYAALHALAWVGVGSW